MRPITILAAVIAVLVSSLAFGATNPASVFCESRGGHVDIETAKDGRQTEFCVLADGTRVNASAYFRSSHRTTH